MNVLLINASRMAGSTGRNCSEIQEYINSKTDSKCFLAYSVGDEKDNTYQIGTTIEKRIHGLLSRLLGKQAWFSRVGTKRLLHYMDSIKPNIIHLNNVHANYLCFPKVLKYAANNDIAVVLTLHDCWFYTGKCCHYTSANCQKWKKACGKCPKLRKDNISWFLDRTDQLLKEKKRLYASIKKLGVIGVSEWITKEAKESILSCAKTITCIYNWVDTEIFQPRLRNSKLQIQLGLNHHKVVIGVASNWGQSKGLMEFNKLAKILGEEYKILLIGRLEENILLEKNIIHVKTVSSPSVMSDYYNLGDVFLTLSIEESFGKVSAEALSCGLPIVCIDSTANKELVGPGCGKVVDSFDLNLIACEIKKICVNGKEKYVENCRQYAVQKFDKNKQIEKHLSLYHSLLEE